MFFFSPNLDISTIFLQSYILRCRGSRFRGPRCRGPDVRGPDVQFPELFVIAINSYFLETWDIGVCNFIVSAK